MRRLTALALSGLFLLPLTACRTSTKESADRAEEIREKYAQLTAYRATAEVGIDRGEESLRYTLRFDGDAQGTRVTVLEPELLAGVTARLSDDALTLVYDDLVLDAGGPVDGVSAVSCVPLVLRAAGEGYLLERGEETLTRGEERVRALRLCWESEADGEAIRCTLWFAPDDTPLRAEIGENEKITAYMEFTSFTFCDTIPSDGVAVP